MFLNLLVYIFKSSKLITHMCCMSGLNQSVFMNHGTEYINLVVQNKNLVEDK